MGLACPHLVFVADYRSRHDLRMDWDELPIPESVTCSRPSGHKGACHFYENVEISIQGVNVEPEDPDYELPGVIWDEHGVSATSGGYHNTVWKVIQHDPRVVENLQALRDSLEN